MTVDSVIGSVNGMLLDEAIQDPRPSSCRAAAVGSDIFDGDCIWTSSKDGAVVEEVKGRLVNSGAWTKQIGRCRK